jgi:hypothetical protein
MGLIAAVSKKRQNVKFLVNGVLMSLDNLKGLFIPINKHGKKPSRFVGIKEKRQQNYRPGMEKELHHKSEEI